MEFGHYLTDAELANAMIELDEDGNGTVLFLFLIIHVILVSCCFRWSMRSLLNGGTGQIDSPSSV